MDAFLILMVCGAFLTAILTAARESEHGYKDDGETRIK
ncbi:Tumour necrosis factor receptor superfamily member 19 [Lacicoccus alkaliphilus]